MDTSILNWLISGLGILANLAITTTVTILIKRWFDKKDKARTDAEAARKEEEEKAKKEKERLAALEEERKAAQMQQMMDQRCQLQIQAIQTAFEPMSKHLALLEDASLSGLRNDLLNNFYRCRDYQKYRTDWDTQNMEDLFKSYEGLHGNSFMKHLMEDFYKIPLV